MNHDSDIQEELKKISPLVAKAAIDKDFGLEDNFFEKLKSKTLVQIKSENENKKIVRFWNTTKISLLAACIIGLLALGLYSYFNQELPVQQQSMTTTPEVDIEVVLDSIPSADLKKYIDENHDEDELFAMAVEKDIALPDENIDTLPVKIEIKNIDTIEFNQQKINIDLELEKIINDIDNIDQLENDLLNMSPNLEI